MLFHPNSSSLQNRQPSLQARNLRAAADAAARDAAGDDTEEEKQNDEELQPLEDLDEDPPKLANPNFTKWHKPCRDPEQVRDHWETFVNQVKRAAWYRAMISFPPQPQPKSNQTSQTNC